MTRAALVPDDFGDRLRDCMRAADLSATEVAAQTGATPAHIRLLQAGKAKPSPVLLKSLCSAFGPQGDPYLTGRTDEPPPLVRTKKKAHPVGEPDEPKKPPKEEPR